MRVTVNDFDTPMVIRQRLIAVGVELDSDIHSVVQAPHRIVGVATAIRIGEVIVERKFVVLPVDDAFQVLRVVVELDVGMLVHHGLDVLVPQVARAVDATGGTQLTLEAMLHSVG